MGRVLVCELLFCVFIIIDRARDEGIYVLLVCHLNDMNPEEYLGGGRRGRRERRYVQNLVAQHIFFFTEKPQRRNEKPMETYDNCPTDHKNMYTRTARC